MSRLRKRAPHVVKVLGRRISVALGERTAAARLRPSFIMVGAQRCGTTSLYRALMAHPNILPPVHHKGIYYFDVNYERGWSWYQGHFPLAARARVQRRGADKPITFEASGYYMYHPHASARIVRDLPDVKVIAMLRDPVERAYSAYQHEFARGFETETFERALELEDERVEPEVATMLDDPTYQSFSHRHHSYRRRGLYAQQLRPFLDGLGPENVVVVESSAFFARPVEEYARIVDLLGLPAFVPAKFDRYNARPRSPMAEGTRTELEKEFAPHDEALARLLGQPPGWRR
ncbi:MAG: sulfotransferase family protein [Acidimicrobiales bacterium]